MFKETVEKGLLKRYSDAMVIKRAIEEGWIIVKDVDWSGLVRYKSLGRGELSSMALAMRKDMLLLTDDSDARDLSEELGVQTHGIIFVLKKAVKSGLITKKDAIKSLNLLVDKVFRISEKLLKYAKDVISSDP